MSIISSLIGAGTSLLSSFLDKGESDDALDYRREMDEKSYRLSRDVFDWQKSYVQNRVADARAAGIHPLYALGTPGASASFTAGSTPTGSGFGAGVARAGEYLARAARPKDRRAQALVTAQIREAEGRAAASEAEAAYTDAQRKKLELDTLNSQAARTFGLGPTRGISRIPVGGSYDPAKEPGVRALEEYTRPDGTRGVKYTEDMQMDEAGQLLVGAQDIKHQVRKRAPGWKQRVRDTVFGPWSRQSGRQHRWRKRHARAQKGSAHASTPR